MLAQAADTSYQKPSWMLLLLSASLSSVPLILFMLISTSVFASTEQPAHKPWYKFNHPSSYYQSEHALNIAQNIVALQRSSGGWGKLVDPSKISNSIELSAQVAADKVLASIYDKPNETKYTHRGSTFDNNATWAHLRFLIRVNQHRADKNLDVAIEQGYRYVFDAQAESGGWPQNYPNTASYGGYLTFNDNAIVGVMYSLMECKSGRYFEHNNELVSKCDTRFARGLEFIIQTQVTLNGKKTGWAQQYTQELQPAEGRVYELPSISALATTNVIKLLMELENPSERIKGAIVSATEWLKSIALRDRKIKTVQGNKYQSRSSLRVKESSGGDFSTLEFNSYGKDKLERLSQDSPRIWARFYDLAHSKPLFAGWDGQPKTSLNEIDHERRLNYRWYGSWPKTLLDKQWPKWRHKYLTEKSE